MTNQELRNWNNRVARATKRNIYIGEKVTARQFNTMTKAQQKAFTNKVNAIKGKRITNIPTVKRGNVNVWKREDINIQRSLTSLAPKQQAFKQTLKKLPVMYGGKKTRLKVGSTGDFKSLFMQPKNKYTNIDFRSVEGLQSYINTFGMSVDKTLQDYKNEFIFSIERNVSNYVIDETQRQELNAIVNKIKGLDNKTFFISYIQNPELDIKASNQYFYILKYGNPTEEDYYNATQDYIDTLKRIYNL